MTWVTLRQNFTVTQNDFISSMNERVKSFVDRNFDVDQEIDTMQGIDTFTRQLIYIIQMYFI